ncbi:TPA: hypothetical protein OOF66_002728 [Morganella morganii]|nr:hypothetical protein [Morganella morganii]HCR4053317.1 hypothetical protein [Morganella morganii]
MTELNKNDWIIEADNSIKNVLANALQNVKNGSWDENQITTNALNAIGRLGKNLKWESQNQSTVWESYKQKGKAETDSGDVLFFINVILSNEVTLEGVIYYEAKKMYLNERLEPTGYSAFDYNQLHRILWHSNYTNILLYDVSLTSSTNDECPARSVGSFALPAHFVYSLQDGSSRFNSQQSKELQGLGKPWANFLADNFSGFGLDYHPEIVEFAKRYISTKHPLLPENIVIATTSKTPEIEPELDRRIINSDLYIPSSEYVGRDDIHHTDN